MAIELEIQSATALVIGEVREKKIYKGRGDQRVAAGRATDSEGRPVSTVNAVVIAEPLGLLGDAQVSLPDVQMSGLEPGAAIRLEGRLSVRLSGREYGAIGAAVTGERLTPLGSFVEWTLAAANGKKPTEARPS